jgi:hypothetical protein
MEFQLEDCSVLDPVIPAAILSGGAVVTAAIVKLPALLKPTNGLVVYRGVCDERHKRIDELLLRIENKLDEVLARTKD